MITFITILIVLGSIGVAGWPLLKESRNKKSELIEDSELSEALTQKESVLLAINELESDYEMGSLSKTDYEELQKKYEEKAVDLIKTTEELLADRGINAISQVDREVEYQVSKARSNRERQTLTGSSACMSCGAPVRRDDVFCSRCGKTLSSKCPHCLVAIDQYDRFCASCGTVLIGGEKSES